MQDVPPPPVAQTDWGEKVFRAPDASGRAAVVQGFLDAVEAGGHDANEPAVVDAAWSVLDALHVAGAGRELGRHFDAHRPQLSIAALRARCLHFRNYGSSRFAHGDALHLLRLRQEAVACMAAHAGSNLPCYKLHLRCPQLQSDGVRLDAQSGEVSYYRHTSTVRFILRRAAGGGVDVVSAYPVQERSGVDAALNRLLPI